MKTIRSLMVMAGLSLVLLTLSVTGATAQQSASLSATSFAGTFNLPFEAQWGRATLPAGEYSLYYGRLNSSSANMVEVIGKENRSPHAFILPQSVNDASTAKSVLVCVREGNAGIIRALEMPQIGTAVEFNMPSGTELMANRSNGKKNVQIAEGPMLIQRLAVTLNSK